MLEHPRPDHIASVLLRRGFECYYVGGCVRDMLLEREPKDYDFATNAKPEEVRMAFESQGYNVIDTGLAFGGVTVVDPSGERYEVTTYRADGIYSDRRRPDTVTFSKTIEEDLGRRDFTINAMAMHPVTEEIIDPFNGRVDLKNHMIEAVGSARARLSEDPLRMMRAARFAAQLEFYIGARTLYAMGMMNYMVRTVPVERQQQEIVKAMSGKRPRFFFDYMERTGILDVVFPELRATVGMTQPSKYHAYDVWTHLMLTLDQMAAWTEDPISRFTAAVHDIGKPKTRTIKEDGQPTFLEHETVGAEIIRHVMENLRFPNFETERVAKLIEMHMVPYDGRWSKGTIRRWVEKAGADWDTLMLLRMADLNAHGTDTSKRMALLVELQMKVEQMRLEGDATPPKLAITGHDVMETLGLKPGPDVGGMLLMARDLIIEDPSKNTRETLLEYLKEIKIE